MIKELLKFLIPALMFLSGAFLYYMDSRHAMKGEAEKTMLRFEVRKQQAYEDADPNSDNTPARMMIIREAQDMITEINDGKE